MNNLKRVLSTVLAGTMLAGMMVVGASAASFPDADVFFPAINADEWTEVDCEHHPSDERNPYAYSFVTLKRK